jgi:hypothetical protein
MVASRYMARASAAARLKPPATHFDPSEVANLDKAQANVEEYAAEIVHGLVAATGKRKGGVKVA